MGNRRRNRPVTSQDHLEESQAASNRNTVMMGNHTTVSINGGSHPRRQRSHHHHQAGSGPQHQTCNNPRCRHRHEGPHSTLQMSTQNCQREFPLAEPIPVSSPASASMSQRESPNPGQSSAQRLHTQTFLQSRHNRNQSSARRDQLSEIRLEDENAATVVQPGLCHHRRNRRRHHHRGHNHHQVAANYPRPACTQSQPQNPQESETQAVPRECSGQCKAMAQPQVLLDQPHSAQTPSQRDNREGQEISLGDENEATAMQPVLGNHRRNRHCHHRRYNNHHQAAANHPRPACTQSQPQNLQESEAQAVPTESSGQHEAMAQSQPLSSDRPTQTQSNSVSSQEPPVQPIPSNSADESEAMAPHQPLRSQPHQPRSAQSQSQPTSPQEPPVQPIPSNFADESEAMAPHQPLRSQLHQPRSAQSQSQPTSPQEPPVQPTPSNSADENEAMPRPAQSQSQPTSPQEPPVQPLSSNSASEREAMALLQPSRSRQHQPLPTQTQSHEHESLSPGHQRQQPHIDSPYSEDRFWLGQYVLLSLLFMSSPHGNQSQQPITTSQDREHRLRLAQTVLSRIIHDLPQRTRASLSSLLGNQMQLPRVFSEDRVDMYLDILIAALKTVIERPQEARNYQALFKYCEEFECFVAQRLTTQAIQRNTRATPNNAIETQHCVTILRHMVEEALHNAKVTQHFATVTEYIAAAVSTNNVLTYHIIGHISAAIRHNDAVTQHRSAMTPHNNAAETQSRIPSTRLSDNDNQRLAVFEFTDEDIFRVTVNETTRQIPDDHSSPDNGLSEDKIQEFPTREFSRSAERSGSDQTSCVVCISDYENKQLLRMLPCFHEFHVECVDEWLKTHRTCPVCRHDVTLTARNCGQE
ncbi:RING finger protein 44 [Plakobranchus ocellatus]|uniref:RING finger protein 44 n=1 Tax=Plakobranchus ocellatus TaxID=259542 RepID=A0AAV4DSF4_9GAST|nr:RING finger protein 44 [Plakobranchus ocellatus]